jgi:two-component system, NtrC family, sensor kinase
MPSKSRPITARSRWTSPEWPITRQWTAGRAVVDANPIHVHDLQAAADEFPEGSRMALGLATERSCHSHCCADDDAIGVLTIRRTEVSPFTDKQIDLLTTFADQAVIAIENVRLFDQVHARTRELTAALEQQTATSDILRAISMSPSSVQPVFETIVRNALPLCGSLFANVFRFDGELLHYVASHNIGPDFLELLHEKYPMRPDSSQVAGRVILTRSVVRLENALEDRTMTRRSPWPWAGGDSLGCRCCGKASPLA